MRIETVSLIISSFVSLGLGVAALLRNFRDKLCIAFSLLAAFLLAHDVTAFIQDFEDSGLGWGRKLHTVLTLLLGPMVIWLLLQLIKGQEAKSERRLKRYFWALLSVVGVVFLMMSFPLYGQVAVALETISHVILVFPAFLWLKTLNTVEKKSSFSRERLRLRFSLWGGIVCLAFFITDALQFSGPPFENVPALGTLARVIYFIYLFQTFIQRELLTAEEVVTKMAHFGGIALLLSSMYLLLTSWVQNQHGLFYFNTFIASFLIIILFDPLRALSTRFVRRVLLRRNILLEEELNSLSVELMGIVEPKELAKRLHITLKECLGTERTSLFLIDRDGLSFLQVDAKSPVEVQELPASSPLLEYMILRRGRPFVIENIENDRDYFRTSHPQKFCEQCLEAMRKLEADFIIPFIYASKPVGFLAVLTGERIVLSNEQLRLFIPVARQVAQALKNAQTFVTQRDREKLAALGEMAAGIAHEIKNPLGAIKGAAELLQEENKNQQSEFLKIILDETNRLSTVLTDFLEYAKPRRQQIYGACDPVKVIEHTRQLVLRDSRVEFKLECQNPVLVEADPELLKQVLFNLFLNAIQAMDGVENPTLKVRIRDVRSKTLFGLKESIPFYKALEGWKSAKAPHAKSYVSIEVTDNGSGISQDELNRVFIPFFTTKPKGTGLGLAMCQRIIEGMHGTIHVKPCYPRGTTFTIHLPMGVEVKEQTFVRTPLTLNEGEV